MADTTPVSRIAIFGHNHCLWPAATLLAKNLPEGMRLAVIEDDGDPAEPVALTLPWESPLHDAIDVTAHDLAEHCNGVFGLGVDLHDWRGDGSHFFSAPSGTLPAINGVALHHVMLRAASMYEEPERLDYLLQPFRFAARAAAACKFSEAAGDPQSPLAMLGPTVQFESAAYGAMLRERFTDSAATIDRGTVASVSLDSDRSRIDSVTLTDGRQIDANLFVDVSGCLSELAPVSLDPGRQSLADILAFDLYISGSRSAREDGGHASARAIAGGLLVETPVRGRHFSELLFSARDMVEDHARTRVGSDNDSVPFSAHFARTPWTGNLVRLGPASARFGPYLSPDMRLLHEQALLLVRHLPAVGRMTVEAAEFNAKQLNVARQLRDFLAIPFLLNARDEMPWASVRGASLPQSLAIRLEQFRSRGRFVTFDSEQFDRQTWIDLMIGFGVVPCRYDSQVDAMDMRRIAPALKQMTDRFTQTIAAMPDRAEYLATIDSPGS
ncbi:tryptophan 7-halogenase [Parasphingopyxis sp.]|uniref:tryptophan 7-halogenase n=1 Tax=Parasphingopyxis sp. TaxID=1920299 RepID=UPI0026371CEF|nr:tryptophan 7-halogenase [Parasphingopyxis sp.]